MASESRRFSLKEHPEEGFCDLTSNPSAKYRNMFIDLPKKLVIRVRKGLSFAGFLKRSSLQIPKKTKQPWRKIISERYCLEKENQGEEFTEITLFLKGGCNGVLFNTSEYRDLYAQDLSREEPFAVSEKVSYHIETTFFDLPIGNYDGENISVSGNLQVLLSDQPGAHYRGIYITPKEDFVVNCDSRVWIFITEAKKFCFKESGAKKWEQNILLDFSASVSTSEFTCPRKVSWSHMDQFAKGYNIKNTEVGLFVGNHRIRGVESEYVADNTYAPFRGVFREKGLRGHKNPEFMFHADCGFPKKTQTLRGDGDRVVFQLKIGIYQQNGSRIPQDSHILEADLFLDFDVSSFNVLLSEKWKKRKLGQACEKPEVMVKYRSAPLAVRECELFQPSWESRKLFGNEDFGSPRQASQVSPLSQTLLSRCVVCMDAIVTCVAIPCGHHVYCGNCCEDLKRKGQPKCSVCGTPVTAFIKTLGK